MPGFSEEELSMFAAEMSDGELAELLLIDQEMTLDGHDITELPARLARQAALASQAAVYAFGNDIELPPNVRVVQFGRN